MISLVWAQAPQISFLKSQKHPFMAMRVHTTASKVSMLKTGVKTNPMAKASSLQMTDGCGFSGLRTVIGCTMASA